MATEQEITEIGVDVFSETTARKLAEILGNIEKANRANAAANMAAAKESLKSVTWSELARYANDGFIPYLLDYGDMVEDVWIDKSSTEEKSYDNPWHFAHMENVELEDGEILENRPFFQTHYAQLKSVLFSNRAFLRCPDGLTAGTYYFTIESSWGSNVNAGDVVQFTLSQNVPAGGRVAGCFTILEAAKANWRIYVYSADGKTILETVTPSFGVPESGTDLGIQKRNVRNGNLNSTQEMAYGWNRWKTSAVRQYLNSTAEKGAWWVAQDEWDIAPSNLNDIPGYLSGVSDEFLAAIKKVKVITYTNTVNDGGAADETYDRVFLPSLEQRYVVPQIKGEGSCFEYWKRRLGLKSPQGWYNDNKLSAAIIYAIENHTTPISERLRSANRDYAYSTWYVSSSSGVYSSYYARGALRSAPIVVI